MASLRRYTFKLYPTKAQESALREQARLCAVLYNALLEMRETHYRRAKLRGDKKTSLTAFDQGKDLTEMNRDPECAEFKALGRGTQERVADMLDLAFKAFYRRAKAGAGRESGYPRYKSTRHAENIPLREPAKSGWKFELKGSDGGCHSADFSGRKKREISSTDAGCIQPGAEHPHLKGGDRRRSGSCSVRPGAEHPHLKGGDRGVVFHADPESGAEHPHLKGGDRVVPTMNPKSVGAEQLHLKGGDRRVKASCNKSSGAEPMQSTGGDRSDKHCNQWRLTLRGVPGAIKARGKFPGEPLSHKTADVKFYAGGWWFSICVEVPERMTHGKRNLRVEFDLIDKFASVKLANGQCVPGLSDPFDKRRNGEAIVATQDKRGSYRWRKEKLRVAKLKAKEARQRKEALHRWSTAIVRAASELEIIAPPQRAMRSGKGNEQFPGAQVSTIAALNRHVLSMAPAAAIQMLEYKCAEAGIACAVTRKEDHHVTVGADLKSAAIATRKAKRVTKRKQKLLEAAE